MSEAATVTVPGVLYLRGGDGTLMRVNVVVNDWRRTNGPPQAPESQWFGGYFTSEPELIRTATEAEPELD
ncbi:hypothetical protein [Frigoriglobus tundricola]|uniref:Uncharacterized protein n=1 Tax=Frigoriglobus tundricola TaxID=2774151 RepID=A0A6M5YGU8_9BACT|nr:hypothetical protein [Frigoriglobus tundricola]QJW93257.1 hypothetical protein FTUN_0762 [Frigoriglobus tundricola]